MADAEDQVNSHSEEEEVSEGEEEAPPPKKAAKPAKAAESDESEPEAEEKEDDDDYEPGAKKGGRKPKASPKKRKADSDEDGSDEDWGKKKKKAGGRGGGGKKGSAFTRQFKLSPELAEVVGADVMPRHEVVKKLWAIIKENKMQDPKNKQFAICDDALLKVIGVKRFRTFGMMKYLKNHFLEAA